MLGLAHVAAPRRPRRPRRSSTRAPRATTRSRSCSPAYTPRGGRGDHRHPGRRPRARPRTSTARPSNACISWGLGVTEHKYGSEVVQLICNLALMTGKVGRPGSALLPLRGQNNVQGSSDMGALPDTYTALPLGRRRGRRALVRGARGASPLSREKGYDDPADVRRRGRRRPEGDVHLRRGRRADRPEHARTSSHALESLEFLVCQDIFETETTKYADVILPASSFLEKTGTFTNAERRIQLVSAGDRPARRRARPTSRSSRRSRAALGHEMGCDDARGRDGRDRRADARLRRRHATSGSAARGLQWPVARRRHRLADPLRGASSTLPGGRGAASPRCPTRRPATPPTTSSR